MRSSSLHDVSELVDVLVRRTGEPGDLTSVLGHIVQTARAYFNADTCNIFANNPITGQFIEPKTVTNPITGEFIEPYTVAGKLLKYRKESPGRPGSGGLTERVLKQGILLVNDVETAPEYQSTFTRLEGIRSFVGLALRTSYTQKPLAVVYLNFREAHNFTSDDYDLYQIFAYQAAFMLQETWLLLRYQEITRIGKEINQELGTIITLFEKLQKYIGNIIDISHTLLLEVYQPQAGTLDLYMQEDGKFIFQENRPLAGASQYVIETKQIMFIRHLSEEHHSSQPLHVEETGMEESLIFVPLVLRDVALGVLSIQHPQPNHYNQEDLFILTLLANHISLALHNIRLYSSLDQLNDSGQALTQLLESEKVMEATADKILEVTKADLVVLYSYEPSSQHLVLSPRIAGTLLNSTIESMSADSPDDLPILMLRQLKPIFAKNSADIYTELDNAIEIRQGSFGQREKLRSMAVMPLRVGDDSVGVLFINFRQPQRFDDPQKLFIEGLANYAAIAIKNARQYDTLLQSRVRELEILQNIDRELTRNLDLNSVLNTLLRLAHEHIPADACSIMLPNPRTRVLEIPAALGHDADTRQATIVSLQETKGITRWVLEQKRSARVDNVHDLPWRDIYLPVTADIVSELDVPLLDGQEVVGILNFESTKASAFRQADQDFLLTLAGQAVLAIKNAQAYDREKRLLAEAQVLNEISKEITSQLNYAHVFDLILEKALVLTHSNLGNLMLYDPNQNNLWMAAGRGVSQDKQAIRQGLDQGIVGYAARNKKVLNIDLTQQPWKEIYLEFFPGARSELAVPMLTGDDLLGVLNVESPYSNNFSESDVRLLTGLAALAVVALQNAQAYEREKHLLAEAQVLNEISKEITSQLNYAHVFDLILEKALELTHSSEGTLQLYDPVQNELRLVAERGVSKSKKRLRLGLEEGVVGFVARTMQPVNVDISHSPWSEMYLDFIPETRSELAVPMLAGGELRGVLNVESSTPNNFNEGHVRVLTGLADLAVVALQNSELYEKADKELQHFQLLYQAAQELGKITELASLGKAYDVILQIAENHSKSQVVIRSYDADREELILVRASHYQHIPLSPSINLNEGLDGQVARARQTIVILDTNHLPPETLSLKLSDPETQSVVIIPIKFEDRYYGNLGLSHKDVGYFRGTDIEFFEGLAQELAGTIYRLQTTQARQEFEQRALSAEEMSSVGQSAFELTHRLSNDLGLVESYVSDIQSELETLAITNEIISRKLNNIVKAARTVLNLSGALKHELTWSSSIDEEAGGPIIVSPRALFEEVSAMVTLPTNIGLLLNIDEDVAEVRAIRGLVIDILRNLLVNAIEAMPGGGKITLSARNATRFVLLEVSDTGAGIPVEKQSKVFDLFFSSKGSSGFGLWSARRNALRNRGDLEIQSQSGLGTTFTLRLPKEEIML